MGGPGWRRGSVEVTTGQGSPQAGKYPCVCCGHLVFEEPIDSHDICAVCFWEDDGVQARHPTWRAGANVVSLVEAQRNYQQTGAKEPRVLSLVRAPRSDEPLDSGWRPIDLEVDDFEPDRPSMPPPEAQRREPYYWRPAYWRRRVKEP